MLTGHPMANSKTQVSAGQLTYEQHFPYPNPKIYKKTKWKTEIRETWEEWEH